MANLLVEEQKSLAEFTSWKVGGEAQYYVAPQNIEQLKEAMILARKEYWPLTVLGGGTNVLVSDKGIPGMVIHTHLLNKVELVEEGDEVVIEAQAGALKSEVLKHFMKFRLAPAVFLAGLPGDMAGGVVMNAGVGHDVAPKEFCEIVKKFETLSFDAGGELHTKMFQKDNVIWSYRKSSEWQPGVITRVQVAWPNNPDEEVLRSVREGNKRRKETQPLSQPSCGSVFKNPEGDHSGRLIEASDLKGFTIGGAQVSEKHANFIVNTGDATALDIDQVIKKIQQVVFEKFQVKLTNEVVYLGDWS